MKHLLVIALIITGIMFIFGCANQPQYVMEDSYKLILSDQTMVKDQARLYEEIAKGALSNGSYMYATCDYSKYVEPISATIVNEPAQKVVVKWKNISDKTIDTTQWRTYYLDSEGKQIESGIVANSTEKIKPGEVGTATGLFKSHWERPNEVAPNWDGKSMGVKNVFILFEAPKQDAQVKGVVAVPAN